MMREFNKRTLDEYVAEGKTVLVNLVHHGACTAED